jgi:hypothetical protein
MPLPCARCLTGIGPVRTSTGGCRCYPPTSATSIPRPRYWYLEAVPELLELVSRRLAAPVGSHSGARAAHEILDPADCTGLEGGGTAWSPGPGYLVRQAAPVPLGRPTHGRVRTVSSEIAKVETITTEAQSAWRPLHPDQSGSSGATDGWDELPAACLLRQTGKIKDETFSGVFDMRAKRQLDGIAIPGLEAFE